jgi:hypothetical protein
MQLTRQCGSSLLLVLNLFLCVGDVNVTLPVYKHTHTHFLRTLFKGKGEGRAALDNERACIEKRGGRKG